MSALAAEESTTMLGITAKVIVQDAQSLTALLAHPDVYLIDMSEEHLRRSQSRVTDVVVNDAYWDLAGWE
jgi:hypothetical protein